MNVTLNIDSGGTSDTAKIGSTYSYSEKIQLSMLLEAYIASKRVILWFKPYDKTFNCEKLREKERHIISVSFSETTDK